MEKTPDESTKATTRAGEEMEKIWKEAAETFQTICGQSLEHGKIRDFRDVEEDIENFDRPAHGEDKSETRLKIKQLGLQSLGLLKVLTSLAKMTADLVSNGLGT